MGFSEEDRLQLRETAKLPEDVRRLEEKVTQLEDRFASKDYGRQLSGQTIESMRNDLRQELRAEMDDIRSDVKGDFEHLRRTSVDARMNQLETKLMEELSPPSGRTRILDGLFGKGEHGIDAI